MRIRADLRLTVDRLAETIDHSANQFRADRYRGVALAGHNRVVQLNSVDFFEGHRENVPVAKTDHLRADSSAGRCHYLAEIPYSGGRTARGEEKANDLDDFTGPRKNIRLRDLIEV
jgi:hypothetical protein